MRTYADNDVSMHVPSMLDQLSDNQVEELQSLVKSESESPTVSERLNQMTAKLSAKNKSVQNKLQESKEFSADSLADLISTPLYKLCNDEFDYELEAA